jgi:ankyrin repeat protein
MHAVESKHASVEIVGLLLDHGADLDQTCQQYGAEYTVAAIGLAAGDPEKVRLLLNHGASFHYSRPQGYTAAHDAARNTAGLIEILEIAQQQGVDWNAITSYQESALRMLSREGRFDAVARILEYGADELQLQWTPLMRAIAIGTLDDVRAAVHRGEPFEAKDWWERTPWLIAILTGDIAKVEYLLAQGADRNARGRCGQIPMAYAIHGCHLRMLRWLIGIGQSVEDTDDFGKTPLMTAVEQENADALAALIAAGADPNRRAGWREPSSEVVAAIGESAVRHDFRTGPAIRDARNAAIASLLLDAGADPADLPYEGRRAIVGLDPEPDPSLFDATPEDYRSAFSPAVGEANPELVREQFWEAMIRSGINAYQAMTICGGTHDDSPIWCAQRFGQSFTPLPDGRIVQIGGEHEDSYDADFCIYNDVFVHYPRGRIEVYCYPEDAFPPTDFHTATRIGDTIWIIGALGYHGARQFGETPVYRLDSETFRIDRVETTGDAPGWISRHRAKLVGDEIHISGGKIAALGGEQETYEDNTREFILDTRTGVWRTVG